MLVKYRALNDLPEFARSMRFFDDALANLFEPAKLAGPANVPWNPPVDIEETENALILKADAPAVKPEDIEVLFENGTLTIKGKREFEKKEEGKGYHRIERSYGAFTRAFTLPETVDPEKVVADYKNGVLTVTIAKKEVAKPRPVKVNVSAN